MLRVIKYLYVISCCIFICSKYNVMSRNKYLIDVHLNSAINFKQVF